MPAPELPSETPEELAGPLYRLDERFARGGMGALWRARESGTDRSVALKRILRDADPESLRRFINEAKITAQLEHPNIVPLHGLGTDPDGKPFYTMKLVRGTDFDVVLKRLAAGDDGTFAIYPLAELLTIFQKVCDAVAFAHSRRIIHRDLKPANIMLGPFGEVLVMDWGLAKVIADFPGAMSREETVGDNSSAVPIGEEATAGSPQTKQGEQTIPGYALGSPHFMAPEQARGEVHRHDARTDIYALGAILYQILSLRRSVSGSSTHEVLERVRTGNLDPLVFPGGVGATKVDEMVPAELRPPKISQPALHHLPGGKIPESLASVVNHAMALEPRNRYQSVIDLQREITAYQNGFATAAEDAGFGKQILLALRRHRREAFIVAAGLLLLNALGIFAFVRVRRERDRAGLLALAEANERHNADEQRGNAETQKKAAEEQSLLANAQRQKAELAANEAKLQKLVAERESGRAQSLLKAASLSSLAIARERFERDDWRSGILYLGQALSYDPQNETATGLLAFQLLYGNASCSGVPVHILQHADYAAFSPDGAKVVTSSDDVRLWGVESGQLLGDPIIHEGGIQRAYFTPDGSRLLIARTTGGAHLWDLRSRRTTELEVEHDDQILDAAISPSGEILVTASKDGTAGLWDLKKSGRLVCPVFQHRNTVSVAAFNADGSRFATYCVDGYAQLWDSHSHRPLGAPLWHGRVSGQGSVCFSPDNKYILSAGGDGTARLWDSHTGKAIGTPLRHAGAVNSAVFSPDGLLIATGSDDGTARIWETTTGRSVGQSLQHAGPVRCVAFSPDSCRVATATDTGARIWDALTGEPLCQMLPGGGFIAFNRDGRYAVTGSSESCCLLLDTESGRNTAQSLVGNERVTDVRQTNGKMILRIEGDITEPRTCEIPITNSLDSRPIGDLVAAVTGMQFTGSFKVEALPLLKWQETAEDRPNSLRGGNLWSDLYQWWMKRGTEREEAIAGNKTFRQRVTDELPKQVEECFSFSSDARSRGHIEDDITLVFHKALANDPTNPLLPLIRVFLEKDPRQAAILRQFAIKRLPTDTNIRKAAGKILRLQNQPEIAIQVYRGNDSSLEATASPDDLAVERKADDRLNEVYVKLRKALDEAGKKSLKQEQLDWLSVRDSMHDLQKRLEFIQARIDELQERITGAR